MRTLTHVLLAKRAGLWHLKRVCSGLLLLCMVASKVWDAETKPIEFLCNKGTRRTMNIAAELETALVRISVSVSPVLFGPPVCLLLDEVSTHHLSILYVLLSSATVVTPQRSPYQFSYLAPNFMLHLGKTNQCVDTSEIQKGFFFLLWVLFNLKN